MCKIFHFPWLVNLAFRESNIQRVFTGTRGGLWTKLSHLCGAWQGLQWLRVECVSLTSAEMKFRNLFLPRSPVLRRSSPTRGHAIVTRFVIAVYSTLWHISRNSLLEESVYPGI